MSNTISFLIGLVLAQKYAGPYTFVAADALVLKVREAGRTVNDSRASHQAQRPRVSTPDS